MAFDLELYKNLPVYSRLLDDESAQVLRHVANALQPELDTLRDRIVNRGYIYNVATTPEDYLDWLQQFVGGAPVGDQSLGLGLNPTWSSLHKRNVIKRLWRYWQMKGTEWGVREGIALWLQWEAAHGSRLDIRHPYGRYATAHPPQWWTQFTPFNVTLNQTWAERQFLGSGDYGQSYRPDYSTLTGPSIMQFGDPWTNCILTSTIAPVLNSPGSMLGPERPRLHCFLREDEWNDIFPDIFRLNPEIWSVNARPTVFGWLTYRLKEIFRLKQTQNPAHYITEEILTIDGFRFGDSWHYAAGVQHIQQETTEVVKLFFVYPGQQFFDSWNSEFTPCPPDSFYYAPGFLVERETTETIKTTPCTRGELAEIVVGSIEKRVGVIAPTLSGQLLVALPAFRLSFADALPVLNLGGNAFLLLPIFDLDLPPIAPIEPIDLSPFQPIKVSDLKRPIQQSLSVTLDASDLPMLQLSAPERYRLKLPFGVAVWGMTWNSGYDYYSPASPGDPGRIETMPVTEVVRLCNTINLSTRRVLNLEIRKTLLPETALGLLATYPALEQVSSGNNWHLLLRTSEELYLLKPSTMFWSRKVGPGEPADRSQSPSLETGCLNLYLEFLVDLKRDTALQAYSLLIENKHLEGHDFMLPLAAPEHGRYGFRFVVPVRFVSGAANLNDDLAFSQYLPLMQRDIKQIKQILPTPDPTPDPTPTPNPIPGTVPRPTPVPPLPEATLRELIRLSQLELQTLVDRLQSTRGDFVIVRILRGGISTPDAGSGMIRTSFTVSPDLGHDSFAVGEIRSIAPPCHEVTRPEVELLPNQGRAILTFWGRDAVLDNTLQVFLYAQNQPR